MNRFQNLLLATALDDRDASTFRHAARLAHIANPHTVYVAHVTPSFELPPDVIDQDPQTVIPVDEDVQRNLETMLAGHKALFPGGTTFHAVAREGSLVPELVRLTSQKSVDLFCLGRRPQEDQHQLSDSAMRLARKVPCSVLIVPPGFEPEYRRILVPMDFSEHSVEALKVACAIARATPGSTVTVLHGYEVPLGWHKSRYTYEEFAGIIKRHAESTWNQLLPTIDTSGVALTARFELSKHIPGTIQNIANELDASLIVLGAHGRTQPAAFLLGHVADLVCERTTRPVLCVKPKGEVVNLLHALLQFFEIEKR